MADTKQRQIIDIPVQGGLKQKMSEPWVDTNSQVQDQNVIWVEQNQAGKRPGFTAESTGIVYPSNLGLTGEINFNWGATSLSSTVALVPNAQYYSVSDGLYIYNNSKNQNYNEWIDYVPPAVGTRHTIGSSPNQAYNPSICEYNGIRLTVWEDFTTLANNTLVYQVIDSNTNARLAQGTIYGNFAGVSPRLITMGTYAVLFWGDVSATAIYYSTLDLSNLPGAWSTPATIVTDWSAQGGLGGCFDVALGTGFTTGGGAVTWVALTYTQLASSTIHLRVVLLNKNQSSTSLSNVQQVSYLGLTGTDSISTIGTRWDAGNSQLWVVYNFLGSTTQSLNGGLISLVFSGSSFTVAFTVANQTFFTATDDLQPLWGINQIGVEVIGAGGTAYRQVCIVFQSQNTSTSSVALVQSDQMVSWALWGANGAFVGPQSSGSQLQMISRPFAVFNEDKTYFCRVYCWCANIETQVSHYLLEFDINAVLGTYGVPGFALPRPCVTYAPRLLNISRAGIYIRRQSSLADVTNPGNSIAGKWTTTSVISNSSDELLRGSVSAMTADFTHPGRSCSVQLGNLTYIGGGVPSQFDGVSCVESGNITTCDPDYPLTSSSTGGGLTNAQTYSYIWIPEWRDSAGNVSYGQPSTPLQIHTAGSTGATAQVSGAVSWIGATRKGDPFHSQLQQQNGLYLIPYRTAFINSAMSTNYYRLAEDPPSSDYLNDPWGLSPTLPFNDKAADATIAAGSLAPITGGVLEVDAPPSFSWICSHNGGNGMRLYGIGDDLRTIWISTVQTDGVPCTFNDLSTLEVGFLGDLTALWDMDDKLFIASSTGLAYITGGGPSNTGLQSDIQGPFSIPSDVGVIDPRAVCVTPIGTVFRTAYGLALLDRSLSVHSDFGDPVTKFLTQYPTTTAIVLHPTRPEILVYTGNNQTNGIVLSFNYRFQAWSQHFLHDSVYSGTGSTPQIAATTISQGNLFIADERGVVFREKTPSDTFQFMDTQSSVNYPITSQWASSWLKPGGTQAGIGFVHQVQLVIQNQDWSNWTIGLNYDYNVQNTYSPLGWTWQSYQISNFASVNGALGSETRISITPRHQRCTSFQVVFNDANPYQTPFAVTGEGPRVTSLSVEVEPIPGLDRLPTAQKG